MLGSAPRESRRTGPHGDTVGKVLPAARRVLAVEGPAALTPSRLHQETGVSRATIYRHWPSPDDLLAEVLDATPGGGTQAATTGTDPLGDALVAVAAMLHQPQTAALLTSGLERARFSEPVAAATHRFLDRMVAPVAAATDGGGQPPPTVRRRMADLVGPLLFDALVGETRPAEAVRELGARTTEPGYSNSSAAASSAIRSVS
ncbi:MAG: TetR/AcrR family transcriptional regulator [Acidimicrobiales bacterium]